MPAAYGSGVNIGAGFILLLALVGLLTGSIVAVVASYQWGAQARRSRAR